MTASLINLPTKNAGRRCDVFILEHPAAVNNGVEGSGMSV